jgi:uncharacterized protein YqeY
MDKRAEFTQVMKDAMKARDEMTLSTVRLIMAKLKDKDIEARTSGKEVDDAGIMSMLQGMVKQRQESADIFAKNGRPELADKENAEIAVIQKFMPAQMDEAAMRKAIGDLVTELGVSDIRDMGKVMGELKKRYAGQMDMGKASGMIKEKLAA